MPVKTLFEICTYCQADVHFSNALICSKCNAKICHDCATLTMKCPRCGGKLKNYNGLKAEIRGKSGKEVAEVVKELSNIIHGNSSKKKGILSTIKETALNETVKVVFLILASIIIAILLLWFGLK
jgi:hypothetical protein